MFVRGFEKYDTEPAADVPARFEAMLVGPLGDIARRYGYQSPLPAGSKNKYPDYDFNPPSGAYYGPVAIDAKTSHRKYRREADSDNMVPLEHAGRFGLGRFKNTIRNPASTSYSTRPYAQYQAHLVAAMSFVDPRLTPAMPHVPPDAREWMSGKDARVVLPRFYVGERWKIAQTAPAQKKIVSREFGADPAELDRQKPAFDSQLDMDFKFFHQPSLTDINEWRRYRNLRGVYGSPYGGLKDSTHYIDSFLDPARVEQAGHRALDTLLRGNLADGYENLRRVFEAYGGHFPRSMVQRLERHLTDDTISRDVRDVVTEAWLAEDLIDADTLLHLVGYLVRQDNPFLVMAIANHPVALADERIRAALRDVVRPARALGTKWEDVTRLIASDPAYHTTPELRDRLKMMGDPDILGHLCQSSALLSEARECIMRLLDVDPGEAMEFIANRRYPFPPSDLEYLASNIYGPGDIGAARIIETGLLMGPYRYRKDKVRIITSMNGPQYEARHQKSRAHVSRVSQEAAASPASAERSRRILESGTPPVPPRTPAPSEPRFPVRTQNPPAESEPEREPASSPSRSR